MLLYVNELIFAVLLPGAKKGRERKTPKSLLNASFFKKKHATYNNCSVSTLSTKPANVLFQSKRKIFITEDP